MNTVADKPKYIPISWKPRLIAGGEGLFSLFLVANQGWYFILFEYKIWTLSLASLNDPTNDLLVMMFHACMVGSCIGCAIITLRSAITGYAPTGGIITYHDFGARYPAGTSGNVKVTEESSSTQVALAVNRTFQEDYIDASFIEGYVSPDSPQAKRTSPQEETHETLHIGEFIVEEAPHEDEQHIQPQRTTRALIVCTVRLEDRGAPAAQAPQEIAQIRKVLYFLISFFGKLTVTVVVAIGSSIKQRTIKLRNQLEAFVAFLATRSKGTRLIWEEELEKHPIFDCVVKHDLDVIKSELKKEINMVIKILDPDHPVVDVLERDEETKNYTFVALSRDWYPNLPAKLLSYYQRVRTIQTDPEHASDIPLKELREVYEDGIVEYNEGFLIEHVKKNKNKKWTWAIAPYLVMRDGHLIFLRYCAERELEYGQQTSDLQIQKDYRKREAKLWRECAFTAMTIYPDREHGEYALQRFLEVCNLLGEPEAAQTVTDEYRRRMIQLKLGRELYPMTEKLVVRVTASLQHSNEE